MTDTNELRAAAEKIVADYEYAEKQGFTMWKSRMLADALKLARGYLAEVDTDCTDAARPSYWRGNDGGVRGACERITAILDGKDNGSGVCGGEPLETLRRRLLALVGKLKDGGE